MVPYTMMYSSLSTITDSSSVFYTRVKAHIHIRVLSWVLTCGRMSSFLLDDIVRVNGEPKMAPFNELKAGEGGGLVVAGGRTW